jgi:hypothetical protein
MWKGLFPQANGIVQTQAVQADPRRVVKTEAALRAAIGDLSAGSTTARGEILIGAPITVHEQITIPCSGLVIRGLGSFAITLGTPLSRLFLVDAFDVRLIDLTVSRGSATNVAAIFAEVGTSSSASGTRLLIRGCNVQCDRLLLNANTTATRMHIVDNGQTAATGGTSQPVISITGVRHRIIGNTLEDNGNDAVRITASGISCAVIGNHFDSGDYTSTASSGGNTLIGNTSVGTVTAHATDRWQDSGAQSLNT